jgi:hypothetical protein
MITYKLDKVASNAEKTGHVVYVKVVDDKAPSVTLKNICVPYETQEQFEKAVEEKTLKYLATITEADAVKNLAEISLVKVADKISALKEVEK